MIYYISYDNVFKKWCIWITQVWNYKHYIYIYIYIDRNNENTKCDPLFNLVQVNFSCDTLIESGFFFNWACESFTTRHNPGFLNCNWLMRLLNLNWSANFSHKLKLCFFISENYGAKTKLSTNFKVTQSKSSSNGLDYYLMLILWLTHTSSTDILWLDSCPQ